MKKAMLQIGGGLIIGLLLMPLNKEIFLIFVDGRG
jgi:hypothetical protein